MNICVWIVREPDSDRQLYTSEARLEAQRKAIRFTKLAPLVLLELHDFQAVCDRDFRFPRLSIEVTKKGTQVRR